MPRIQVRPERLRDLSQRLSQAAGDVAGITRHVTGATGSLDWQVRQQGAIESSAQEAAQKGHRLAEHLTAMSRYLAQKSQAMEAADNAASTTGQSAAKGFLQRAMDAWRRSVGQVKQELALLLGLGNLIAPSVLPLPVLEGLDWLRRMRPDLFKRAPGAGKPSAPDGAAVKPQKPDAADSKPDSLKPRHDEPQQSEPQFDGTTPAPGVQSTDIREHVVPTVTSSSGHRSPATYNNVLNQFAVNTNPRYGHRDGNTFCNVFVRDVSEAMGAPIPPLTAEDMTRWLLGEGGAKGWRVVTDSQAVELANQGKPVVVAWPGPEDHSDSGHVAMVRPRTDADPPGIPIANSGQYNLNHTTVAAQFGGRKPIYFFVHD